MELYKKREKEECHNNLRNTAESLCRVANTPILHNASAIVPLSRVCQLLVVVLCVYVHR